MRFVLRRWQIESYVAVDPNSDHNGIFETRFRESGLPVQDFRIYAQAFPVQDLDMIDGLLDVSDFAASGSLRGQRLLNFFLECRADLLPPEFREEVVDFIKSLAFPENNHQVIFHPVGVFSISRTSDL